MEVLHREHKFEVDVISHSSNFALGAELIDKYDGATQRETAEAVGSLLRYCTHDKDFLVATATGVGELSDWDIVWAACTKDVPDSRLLQYGFPPFEYPIDDARWFIQDLHRMFYMITTPDEPQYPHTDIPWFSGDKSTMLYSQRQGNVRLKVPVEIDMGHAVGITEYVNGRALYARLHDAAQKKGISLENISTVTSLEAATKDANNPEGRASYYEDTEPVSEGIERPFVIRNKHGKSIRLDNLAVADVKGVSEEQWVWLNRHVRELINMREVETVQVEQTTGRLTRNTEQVPHRRLVNPFVDRLLRRVTTVPGNPTEYFAHHRAILLAYQDLLAGEGADSSSGLRLATSMAMERVLQRAGYKPSGPMCKS